MFLNDRSAVKSRRLFEAAERDNNTNKFYEELWEALRKGEIVANELSIRACFEQFVEGGIELVRSFSPRKHGGGGINLLEAGDAVDTSAFSNITGQIFYSTVLDVFDQPQFLADRLLTTVPTEFNGEKIPGIGGIGDAISAIGEGQEYPTAGVSEEWVETPETDKNGVIVPVTKEAIFFDRTGLVITRASNVALSLAINKEKRCLDVALGITTSYVRNGAAAQATYGDTHTEGDFDNLIASNALVDYTDVENGLVAFGDVNDPNTEEPIVLNTMDVVVPEGLLFTAARVFEATGIEQGAIAAGVPRTLGGNPLTSPTVKRNNSWTIHSNQYVNRRTSDQTTWFQGDFKGAFAYMQNWGPTVVQAQDNSHEEFHKDIVSQFKISERGIPAVMEPRKVQKHTA